MKIARPLLHLLQLCEKDLRALAFPGLLSFSKVNALALSLRWILPCAFCSWLLAAFYPHMRIGISQLIHAAVLWVIVVIFWRYKTIKESRIPRTDEGERKSCPRRKKQRSTQ